VDSKEDKAGHLIEPRLGRLDRLDFILCKNKKSRAVTPSNKKSRAVTPSNKEPRTGKPCLYRYTSLN
jgi:hypothetical protein